MKSFRHVGFSATQGWTLNSQRSLEFQDDGLLEMNLVERLEVTCVLTLPKLLYISFFRPDSSTS
jgi:hypothetical protein